MRSSECLKWVKLVDSGLAAACPLFPQSLRCSQSLPSSKGSRRPKVDTKRRI